MGVLYMWKEVLYLEWLIEQNLNRPFKVSLTSLMSLEAWVAFLMSGRSATEVYVNFALASCL